MKKILIAAVLVAWAGTLYGAYVWGSNQGPSDSMTAAAGQELSADDRLDAAVQAAGHELSADERLDAVFQVAGRELTADERLDAFIRASRELSARNAAGREQMRAAAIQAARRERIADAFIQGVRQAACLPSLPIGSIFCIAFPLDSPTIF